MDARDMEPYRVDFDAACHAFGWVCWTETSPRAAEEKDVWVDARGAFLFAEEDLSEGMVRELIRLGNLGAV